MNINTYMLREYIKLILEKRDVKEAQTLGLALMRIESGLGPAFSLYDANKLLKLSQNGEEPWVGDLKEYILGMIVMKKNSGKCNNANEVKMVASQGFGEMMYAIAAQFSPNGIVPDRGAGTTPVAQNTWKNTLIPNASSSEPLDNQDSPVTPNKNDDCEVKYTDKNSFDIEDVHPLDKSYKFSSKVNTSELESNHKKFLQGMSKYMDPKKAEELLYGYAVKYFNSKLDFGSFFS